MRSDKDMLDYVEPLFHIGPRGPGVEPTVLKDLEARIDRLNGAVSAGLTGRAAISAAMGAVLLEPGDPMPSLTGADLIVAERQRQIDVEGHSIEADAQYVDNELALAAACYAMPDAQRRLNCLSESAWPWAPASWKPTPEDRTRELVKAGALIAAEIDRRLFVARADAAAEEPAQ